MENSKRQNANNTNSIKRQPPAQTHICFSGTHTEREKNHPQPTDSTWA